MSRIGFTELSPEIGSILLDALRSNSRRLELVKDVIMPYVAEQIREAAPWDGFHDVSFVEYYDPTPSPNSMLNTHYIKVSGEDHEGLRLVRTYFDGCSNPSCHHTIHEGQVVAPPELLQWLKEDRVMLLPDVIPLGYERDGVKFLYGLDIAHRNTQRLTRRVNQSSDSKKK